MRINYARIILPRDGLLSKDDISALNNLYGDQGWLAYRFTERKFAPNAIATDICQLIEWAERDDDIVFCPAEGVCRSFGAALTYMQAVYPRLTSVYRGDCQ